MFNELKQLEWLYNDFGASGSYMPEDILVHNEKDFCMDDVHMWGRLDECRGVYGRLKDLVRVRLMGAVEVDKLDRAMVMELMRPYGVGVVEGDGGMILSETDRAMLRRAGVLYD